MTGRGLGGLNYVWEDNVIINHKEILRGCELDVSGLGYYVVAGSYLLTYLLSPWSTVLLEQLTGLS